MLCGFRAIYIGEPDSEQESQPSERLKGQKEPDLEQVPTDSGTATIKIEFSRPLEQARPWEEVTHG